MPEMPSTAGPRHATRGFTLTELVVTLTIVAGMAAMSLPSFQRAIEQSRADIAVANLRAVWAAERLYWLEYHSYTPITIPATAMQSLENLGLIDAEIVSGSGGYSYAVTAATENTFTATATHVNGLGSFSIKETGAVSGHVILGNGENALKIRKGIQWESTDSP